MSIVLAHGASGSAASMSAYVSGLRDRGIDAAAIDLPVRKAEDAIGAYRAAVDSLGADPARTIIGGHSYGGRVASLLAVGADNTQAAADGGGAWAGLVLLSYPLHRPGHPEAIRTAHWPALHLPVLALSGESDPFARIDLLREALRTQLPSAELVTYPRLGHGLGHVLDDVLDRIADFSRSLDRDQPSARG